MTGALRSMEATWQARRCDARAVPRRCPTDESSHGPRNSPRRAPVTPRPRPPPSEPARPASAANAWPEIDLATEAFYRAGTTSASSVHGASRRQRLADRIADAYERRGRHQGGGWWRTADPQQTKLDVAIDAHEAGACPCTLPAPPMRSRARRPRSRASSRGPAHRAISTIRRSTDRFA